MMKGRKTARTRFLLFIACIAMACSLAPSLALAQTAGETLEGQGQGIVADGAQLASGQTAEADDLASSEEPRVADGSPVMAAQSLTLREDESVEVATWDGLARAVYDTPAKEGRTISLKSDVHRLENSTVEQIEVLADCQVTIDLNNHTLDREADSTGEGRVIIVHSGAELTIKNGSICGGKADNGGGIYAESGATVNLKENA